jgi:hypothetical protein
MPEYDEDLGIDKRLLEKYAADRGTTTRGIKGPRGKGVRKPSGSGSGSGRKASKIPKDRFPRNGKVLCDSCDAFDKKDTTMCQGSEIKTDKCCRYPSGRLARASQNSQPATDDKVKEEE